MTDASFVISLDCEGKWGMADHIGPNHDAVLTTSNLEIAYRRILALFARYEIPATFAFVMAFTLSPSEWRKFDDLFKDVELENGNWLHHFRRQLANGNHDGWFAPGTLQMVQEAELHEIGCHGFSHLPIGDSGVDTETANGELRSAGIVAKAKGISLQTFIYPRGLIAHTDALISNGYVGYRESLYPRGGLSRQIGALGELYPYGVSQSHTIANDTLQPIPSGYFLNWRSGLRRLVPPALTVSRWRNIVDHAIRTESVAHLWLHPHNILTGPGTFETLEDILKYVAKRRDQGKIQVVTQLEYCKRQRRKSSKGS